MDPLCSDVEKGTGPRIAAAALASVSVIVGSVRRTDRRNADMILGAKLRLAPEMAHPSKAIRG